MAVVISVGQKLSEIVINMFLGIFFLIILFTCVYDMFCSLSLFHHKSYHVLFSVVETLQLYRI